MDVACGPRTPVRDMPNLPFNATFFDSYKGLPVEVKFRGKAVEQQAKCRSPLSAAAAIQLQHSNTRNQSFSAIDSCGSVGSHRP